MKVSLDGGVTFHEALEGVRIVLPGVQVPGEDDLGELHINVTEEGIVQDVWASREDQLDHNIGTRSQTHDEAIEAMVEVGA